MSSCRSQVVLALAEQFSSTGAVRSLVTRERLPTVTIMVTITCMLVVANVQSSVGDMIPKTSYFKMIDYFLLYSLNIIILVMVGK